MELDFSEQISSAKKRGLWDNIRDKKKRMGKNYKPAKPGSKAYPDKKAFEKAQAAIELTYTEAEKKTLNKPFRLPSGSKKKFGVYVKKPNGNVVVVKFGDPNMEIKRDDPDRRKSFRARHHCDTNPGPKWKARYWSCKMWQGGKSVTQVTKGSIEDCLEIEDLHNLDNLLKDNPLLSEAQEVETEDESQESSEEAIEMAMVNLMSIEKSIQDIKKCIQGGSEASDGLTEAWIAAKLTLAEDYMSTISKYLCNSDAD